ncbi:MAG: hypothetical protein WAK01_05895 [Methylocystis sp.]
MTVAGWLEIALALVVVVAPVERGLYRRAGIDPENEQDRLSYTFSMIIFSCG